MSPRYLSSLGTQELGFVFNPHPVLCVGRAGWEGGERNCYVVSIGLTLPAHSFLTSFWSRRQWPRRHRPGREDFPPQDLVLLGRGPGYPGRAAPFCFLCARLCLQHQSQGPELDQSWPRMNCLVQLLGLQRQQSSGSANCLTPGSACGVGKAACPASGPGSVQSTPVMCGKRLGTVLLVNESDRRAAGSALGEASGGSSPTRSSGPALGPLLLESEASASAPAPAASFHPSSSISREKGFCESPPFHLFCSYFHSLGFIYFC